MLTGDAAAVSLPLWQEKRKKKKNSDGSGGDQIFTSPSKTSRSASL